MVETLSSVAQVYWRPQKTWHIASCSVINDVAIHVWDIRRPFIPFASFEEHRDVTTGTMRYREQFELSLGLTITDHIYSFIDMSWNSLDPDKFISVGKDGLILEHHFADAQRPIDYCTPVAVDISVYGEIGLSRKSLCSKYDPRLVRIYPFVIVDNRRYSISTSIG